MKYNYLTKFLTIGLISITLLNSCKKEPATDKPITEEEKDKEPVLAFSINFNPLFDNKNLEFNEMKWVTSSGDTLNFSRIRMILSNLKLIKSNDEEVSLDTFAYLSLHENRNSIGFEKPLPAGNYKGLKFDIGLDSNINHGDPEQWPNGHPLSPLVNQMHWTWATGYIFMVVEGYYMNNNDKFAIFSFHMANMVYKKAISIEKTGGFSIEENQKGKLDINMHIDKYFGSTNQVSMKNDGSSSHSNSAEERILMNKLHENLSQVFEIK